MIPGIQDNAPVADSMNIAVMALLTVLIYAEKALPIGRQISQIAGAALIAYGALVIWLPAALPLPMGM